MLWIHGSTASSRSRFFPRVFLRRVTPRNNFDREARTISSLNHPNISTLHDVGHQNGVDYLVMEYLAGETLASRLNKDSSSSDQVVKYGIEICEGLEVAHRTGVVHRDLKPGNIMLTQTGVKLLDFGLAKSLPANASASASLTVTQSSAAANSPLTEKGMVVGTFQYMSPEQVRGKEVDGRSDIFSLGAVLYEMVTGKRAFEGKSHLSVAAAILEDEPVPIVSVKPLVSAVLDHAIVCCVAKSPEDRWQTARDLALELKWAAESGAQTGIFTPAVPRKAGRQWLAWSVAALLGATVVLTTFLFRGKRLSMITPCASRSDCLLELAPSLSRPMVANWPFWRPVQTGATLFGFVLLIRWNRTRCPARKISLSRSSGRRIAGSLHFNREAS